MLCTTCILGIECPTQANVLHSTTKNVVFDVQGNAGIRLSIPTGVLCNITKNLLCGVQGNAGIGLSILTVLMSVSIVLIAALSAVGVCERCHVESGGVYFLIAHILGSRIGGSVGVIYCFAQVSFLS